MTTVRTAKDTALWYHGLGANVIPVVGRTKTPDNKWKKWIKERQTREDVTGFRFPDSIAIVLGVGGWSCIDFDGHETDGRRQPVSTVPVKMVASALGLDFDTYRWVVRTPSGGYHLWLLTEGIKPQSFRGDDTSELYSDTLNHIEWRAEGNYTLAPHSGSDLGRYEFINGEPVEAPKKVTREGLGKALRLVLRNGISVLGDSYQNGTNGEEKPKIRGNMVGYLCSFLKTEAVEAPKLNGNNEYEVRIAGGENHGGYHVVLRDRDDKGSGYYWNNFRDERTESGEHIGGGKIGGGWADLVAYTKYGKLYKTGTPLSTLTTKERKAVEDSVKEITGYTPRELSNHTNGPTTQNGTPSVSARERKTTAPEYVREWIKARGFSVRYNELKYRVEFNDGTGVADGERWEMARNTHLCEWASEYEDFTRKPMATGRLWDYLTAEAVKNKYDPIRTYFDGLPKWDGVTNYIEELAEFLPMEEPELWRKHLTKWMIGAYACGYYTASGGGYKNELFLVIHGAQGAGKTFFVENLIPNKLRDCLYSGSIADDKDSRLTMSQHWIVNHEELESLGRIDKNFLKKTLSDSDITVRPPYGAIEETRPRRMSFIGSTNEQSFLTDDTGSRRFLIHTVLGVGITNEDRDRLGLFDVSKAWAQAKALHEEKKYGWAHYLTKEEEAESAILNKRYEFERVEDYIIKKYIDTSPYGIDKEYLNSTEITTKLAEKMSEADKRLVFTDKGLPQRIGRALVKAGLHKKKVRSGEDTAWKYLVAFKNPQNEGYPDFGASW